MFKLISIKCQNTFLLLVLVLYPKITKLEYSLLSACGGHTRTDCWCVCEAICVLGVRKRDECVHVWVLPRRLAWRWSLSPSAAIDSIQRDDKKWEMRPRNLFINEIFIFIYNNFFFLLHSVPALAGSLSSPLSLLWSLVFVVFCC